MLLAPLILAAQLAVGRGPSVARSLPSSDVLLVILDDVAAVDLACYGGLVPAPNLDALAAQGVRFDAAFANPTCSVTRRSLLFGHWQFTDSGPPCSPPSPRSPTLADVCLPRLLDRTSVLVGKWHLGGAPSGALDLQAPFEHGFDHWVGGSQANVNDCGGSTYSSWRKVEEGFVAPSSAYEPYVLSARTRFWWDAIGSAKIVVVGSALAHGPMHAPPVDLLPPGHVVGGSARARYEAMILAFDAILGQILADVNLATTLVIVIGDNGTPINVSPDPERSKTTTFERGIRVPLVIAGGTVAKPGRVSGELVHAVDVYSTILDWCGEDPPTLPQYQIVGVSLLPSLMETQQHAYHDHVLCGNAWGNPGGDRCARTLAGKLRQLDDDGDDLPDREEFYDLTIDPSESTDLSADPLRAAEIAVYRAWLAKGAF